MAGEVYIGTDDQGRPRYRDRSGRLLPADFKPQSRTPSGKVTSKVSERSRSLISDALGAVSGLYGEARTRDADVRRGTDAVRSIGGMVRDTSIARDEFRDANRGYYGGDFENEGRYGGEWQGYREGFDSVGDPNAPFQMRVAGDAEKILKGMDPGVLARLQDRMQAAGYMTGGAFAPGAATDPKTLDAFKGLLSFSNTRGMIWQEALTETERVIKETGVGGEDLGEGPAPFIEAAYLAPDYATLAQEVKDKIRSQLGRDPDDAELALFTAEMSGWNREGFDEAEAARRAEYDAMVAAGETGAEVGTPEGEFQDVDRVARFKESFEKRFKGELAGLERNEEVAESQELTTGAVSTLSRMAGGMG